MEYWHIWLIVGFVLALAEILVHGFFLLPFGVAAGVTALVSVFLGDVVWQLLVFVVGGALFVSITRRFFVRAEKIKPAEETATNIEGLVGRTAIITQPVSFERRGYVRVGGEEWAAVFPRDDDTRFEIGEHVRLTGVQGNSVLIDRIET